VRAGARA